MWLKCEITWCARPGVGETALAESQRVRRSTVTEQGGSVRSQQDTAIIDFEREIYSHTKTELLLFVGISYLQHLQPLVVK